MKAKNPIKKIFVSFLILVFILSPLDFRTLFSHSQAQSIEEITGDEIWDKDRTIDTSILIAFDATLAIKKGITITFKEYARLEVKGELIAKGTVENPIKFQGENNNSGYSVIAMSSGKINMRSVNISGGGFWAGLVQNNNDSFLKIKKAYANHYQGAIATQDFGSLTMENCEIHNNKVGVTADGGNVKVNRSKFHDNEYIDIYNQDSHSADFRYNWWGNANGPETYLDYFGNPEFEKIIGNVSVEPWITKENFHDPVIIVPGIMGSWKWTNKSEWKLDPIFKTYDELYDTFNKNGYTPEEDLFIFPYNWRGSNVYSAQLLRYKIQEIKQATNWPKVDVVTHSMGGLLTREYIKSDYYQDDVDQLVALGTPHSGAPKDYLMWEGGEFGKGIVNNFFEKVITLEAHENDYASIFDYVRNCPIESIRELLPIYNYLKDKDAEELKIYLNDYPRNEFLENLNKPENISKLDNIELINIFGKTENNKTISTIRLEETPDDLKPMWEHGYPENYNSLLGDHGLEYGEGDGTVPLQSVKNISADEEIETNYSHNQLPSKAADIAYEYITGQYPIVEAGEIIMPKNILLIMALSPIDIQVFYTDQNGIERKIGNEISNQTEDGANYFKYYLENESGEEIGQEIEFLTIPNPQDGEYKILTQGTGDGKYKIEAVKIQENEDTGEISEIANSITGTAQTGIEDEIRINLTEDEITFADEDTVPPIITPTSPQSKEYLNNQILNIEFTVEDNKTEPENIKTKIYLDGKENTYFPPKADQPRAENRYFNLDLSLQNLGNHTIKITAQDKAENQSEEEITFKNTTKLGALTDNIRHYHKLKLIKRSQETKILTKAVKNLKKAEKLIRKIQDNKRIKSKIKNKIIELIQKKTNKYISRTIKFINHKSDKLIKSQAKELLIESLEWLKY